MHIDNQNIVENEIILELIFKEGTEFDFRVHWIHWNFGCLFSYSLFYNCHIHIERLQ